MPNSPFQSRPGETVLYQADTNHKWYTITWKVFSGLVATGFLTFLLYFLLGPSTQSLLSFLPGQAAFFLTRLLYFGIVPLVVLAWVVEGIAAAFTGEMVLTDQRLWVRGSPFSWRQSDTPLEDISSMVWRRDAVFIRLHSNRKVQVHMFAEGKLMVKAYEKLIGKGK